MREPMQFGEWLYAPRGETPGWLKALAAGAVLAAFAFATGLWLEYRPPTVTLVPGSPVLVALNDAEETRDPQFIHRLLNDLNGKPPYPPNSIGSCYRNPSMQVNRLRFEYANGDRLTIEVHEACRLFASAAYAPEIVARVDATLLDDINAWPMQ